MMDFEDSYMLESWSLRIIIYKIFALHPQILAHSSQNPWNFPNVENDKSIFSYVTMVTWGGHPRVGAGCLDNHHVVRGLGLTITPPPTSHSFYLRGVFKDPRVRIY